MNRAGWGMALMVAFAVASACGGRAATDADTSATAGAAGAADAKACSLPRAPGSCRGYEPSFWHDPKTGLCEPFNYGGCEGNANRFASHAECVAACPGGGSDWGACQRDSDCDVASAGCCPACEPLAASQLYALNREHSGDEYRAQCSEVPPCLACDGASNELEATGKYFVPRCSAGQCTVVDVRASALTECASANDCVLRDGAGCCPSCQSQFIAVNGAASFCSDGDQPCGQCISVPVEGLATDCVSGRCTLTLD